MFLMGTSYVDDVIIISYVVWQFCEIHYHIVACHEDVDVLNLLCVRKQ